MKLNIVLLTVGVLAINDKIKYDNMDLQEINFFCEPGEDATLNYDPNSLIATYSLTNDFWHQIPDLERQADADEKHVWQQILWEINGNFEIKEDVDSLIDFVGNSIGCNLWVETTYDIELINYHWRVISVTKDKAW